MDSVILRSDIEVSQHVQQGVTLRICSGPRRPPDGDGDRSYRKFRQQDGQGWSSHAGPL